LSGLTGIAIVGAGPYGLSIASHLRRQGIDYRILGTPMHNWRTRMPQGMRLKSDGFASNLYLPMLFGLNFRRPALAEAQPGVEPKTDRLVVDPIEQRPIAELGPPGDEILGCDRDALVGTGDAARGAVIRQRHLAAGRHPIRHYFRAKPTDRALARYHLLDPIPYFLVRRGWVDDSDVAVDVARMNAYAWREPARVEPA
jgi:hypothetical protein